VLLTAQQDGGARRWALNYTGSPWLHPVLTSNPSHRSTGRGFRAFSVTGDRLLGGKWRLEAGYFRTEVSYGDDSRTMEGMQAGMKRYFTNPDFFIQPYLAMFARFNWGRRLEGRNEYDAHQRLMYARNPYVSLVPAVGTDIYLLSPLALVVRYDLNIGLDAETVAGVKSPPEEAYLMKDRGLFHHLELGLRVTFPFRISDGEGVALRDVVRNIFYNNYY
jgi:hypothetical protein